MPNTILCLPYKYIPSEICDNKYIGPLCQTCNKNFAHQFGSFECTQCYSKKTNYVLIIIIIILFTVFLAIYIRYINTLYFTYLRK